MNPAEQHSRSTADFENARSTKHEKTLSKIDDHKSKHESQKTKKVTKKREVEKQKSLELEPLENQDVLFDGMENQNQAET